MNVLSCFDGISAGRVALERAGVKIDNYFSSEIDKYALEISQNNYPDTIQLGDVNEWKTWDLPKIDLVIGGSPCQGFSVSGLHLNFDDPRSKLLFTFLDILEFYKPKYFLLENVRMKKEWRDIITKLIGVEPIEIDSALVSAQTRKRYYWTNIPNVTQPEDKGILLKDIIEDGFVNTDKSYCIDASYYKGGSWKYYMEHKRRQLVMRQSERRLQVQLGPEDVRKFTPLECERLQTFPEGYTKGISNTQRWKCLGNSWTVDVVAHIFSFIPKGE